MILVDTSVWIDLLDRKSHPAVAEADLFSFVSCGPVLQEVLQGLRPGADSEAFRRALLALPRLADPLPITLFESASEIYRQGRRRGLTIRSSTDCLIAAIALDSGVPVWHRDRDFDVIARYTPLRCHRPENE